MNLTYLYSYGTRRHIADPIQNDPTRPPSDLNHAWSLCDQLYEIDSYMVARGRYARDVEQWVDDKRKEPVCARCQRMWDRIQAAEVNQ